MSKRPRSHGSARFANKEEIKNSDLFWGSWTSEEGIVLNPYLSLKKQGHLLTVGSNRSGKGTHQLIPSLLSLKGQSAVVLDPKGENAAITHAHHERMQIVRRPEKEIDHNVILFNPWNLHGLRCDVLNPFDFLDGEDPELFDDAAMLASVILADEGAGEVHWTYSAQDMITAILAHIACHLPNSECHPVTLYAHLRQTEEDWQQMIKVMQHSPVKNPFLREQIIREGNRLSTLHHKEMASIRSTAQRATSKFSGQAMHKAMTGSAFDLQKLTSEEAIVYVMIPLEKVHSHRPITRLIIGALTQAAVKHSNPNRRVVFYLDEFTTLGPMKIIEQGFASFAGKNITFWPFMQDISQLKRQYPESWSTFLANSRVTTFFSVNDVETATLVSNALGKATVWSRNVNRGSSTSQTHGQSRTKGNSYSSSESFVNPNQFLGMTWFDSRTMTHSTSENSSRTRSHSTSHSSSQQEGFSEVGRSLMTPDEVLSVDQGTTIIFADNLRPIGIDSFPYWDDYWWKNLHNYLPTYAPSPLYSPSEDAAVPAIKKIRQSMPPSDHEVFNTLEDWRQDINADRMNLGAKDERFAKICCLHAGLEVADCWKTLLQYIMNRLTSGSLEGNGAAKASDLVDKCARNALRLELSFIEMCKMPVTDFEGQRKESILSALADYEIRAESVSQKYDLEVRWNKSEYEQVFRKIKKCVNTDDYTDCKQAARNRINEIRALNSILENKKIKPLDVLTSPKPVATEENDTPDRLEPVSDSQISDDDITSWVRKIDESKSELKVTFDHDDDTGKCTFKTERGEYELNIKEFAENGDTPITHKNKNGKKVKYRDIEEFYDRSHKNNQGEYFAEFNEAIEAINKGYKSKEVESSARVFEDKEGESEDQIQSAKERDIFDDPKQEVSSKTRALEDEIEHLDKETQVGSKNVDNLENDVKEIVKAYPYDLKTSGHGELICKTDSFEDNFSLMSDDVHRDNAMDLEGLPGYETVLPWLEFLNGLNRSEIEWLAWVDPTYQVVVFTTPDMNSEFVLTSRYLGLRGPVVKTETGSLIEEAVKDYATENGYTDVGSPFIGGPVGFSKQDF